MIQRRRVFGGMIAEATSDEALAACNGNIQGRRIVLAILRFRVESQRCSIQITVRGETAKEEKRMSGRR